MVNHEITITVKREAVKERFRKLQEAAPSAIIVPVIKNNANGLGSLEMYKLYASIGAKYVACSYAREFLCTIPANDESLNKISWIWTPDREYKKVKNLILVCKNLPQIAFCEEMGIHYMVCFDIAMNRGGFSSAEINKVNNAVKTDELYLGVFTHCPHETVSGTEDYLADYEQLSYELPTRLVKTPSIANSFVFTNNEDCRFGLCRIGESLLLPRVADEFSVNYDPIEVSTYIADYKMVYPGQYVGYDAVKIEKSTKIAILPVGYYTFEADVLKKVLVCVGDIKIKCDIITAMHDTMVIDITKIPDKYIDNNKVIIMNLELKEDNWNRCIQKTFKINKDLAYYEYI